MRKLYCILLCGFIILSVLGCADKDTFAGANREERIIMSLEKTYPEHTFQIVKPYDKYKGIIMRYVKMKREFNLKFIQSCMIIDIILDVMINI